MSPSSELAARLENQANAYDMLALGSEDVDMAQHAADLRAAAQAVRSMEWRPITDAPDNKPLLIGKWFERDWMEPVGTFSKLAAQRLGYTHYFIVPAPPEVGG